MLLSPIKISPFARRSSGIAPVNTVAPEITGTLEVGQTLTVVDGTYTGVEPIIITRNWQRDGVDLVGETTSTYLLDVDDEGGTIRVRELATDNNGLTTTTYSNELYLFGIGYMVISTTFEIS